MKTQINEIEVNGEVYIKKDSVKNYQKAESYEGMDYVVIRTYSAGVHIGYLKSQNKKEVELLQARRIYSWSGAFTLSELSKYGVSSAKIATTLDYIKLTEAIEIIPITEKSKKILDNIKYYEV